MARNPSTFWNLNTLFLICSLLTMAAATIKYGGPILQVADKMDRMENRVERVGDQVTSMEKIQVAQAENLKVLTQVSKDNSEMRRDLDKHTVEAGIRFNAIEDKFGIVNERLKRLEQK